MGGAAGRPPRRSRRGASGDRSWCSSVTRSPSTSRASRRACCSSINASRARVSSDFGMSPTSSRASRIASSASEPRAGRVALGEHEVDHDEHAVDAIGEVVGRYAVGDAGMRDLLLRAQEALSHRRLRGQECPPDRRGREPGDDLERQGHARLESERRVAAREDQSQAVIAHRRRLGTVPGQLLERGEVGELAALDLGAAQHVDRPAPRRRGEPRGRVVGYAVAWPGHQGPLGGVGDRVLREVPVAGRTDEGGDDAQPLLRHGVGERTTDVVHRAPTVAHALSPRRARTDAPRWSRPLTSGASRRSRWPRRGRRTRGCRNRRSTRGSR